MTLPLPKLPPLELVRSFVAVGRRMSITLAAAELSVTQSAVSRQIASLEDLVGTRLFVRTHRALTFTPAGERLFAQAEPALTQLQIAFGEVLVPRDARPVTITASTGFAGLWLVPRIARLQAQFPDVELRLAASNRVVDARAEGIDLAIRYGDRSSVPDGAVPLLGETIAPVARPGVVPGTTLTADDLARAFLLEFDDSARRPHLGWAHWLEARGWTTRPRGIQRFNQYDQAIHAAATGQGIALGRPELIGDLLDAGTLVLLAPPEPAPGDRCGQWLMTLDANPRRDVRDVLAWLQQEAQATLAAEARRRAAI